MLISFFLVLGWNVTWTCSFLDFAVNYCGFISAYYSNVKKIECFQCMSYQNNEFGLTQPLKQLFF